MSSGPTSWHRLRLGIVTASIVGKLITEERPDAREVPCPECAAETGMACVSKRKPFAPIATIHGERTKAAAHLPARLIVANNDTSTAIMRALAAERITGHAESTPTTADMLRGIDSEPYARDHYSEHHAPVDEMGFIVRTEDDWTLGLSPDGMVGTEGGIEVKAPRAKTHLATILTDEVPPQYMGQVQSALLVTGRPWWDYVSYYGGMPMWVIRVYPDPDWHAAIVAAATQAERDITALVDTYESKVAGLPATERLPDPFP